MIGRTVAAAAALGVLLGSVSGCYDYQAVRGLDELAPGSDVRVTLTRAGRLDLEEQTGRLPSEAGGQVLRSEPDSLFLLATRATPFRPGERTRSDTLRLSRSGIGEVRRKELDRGRSAALAIGGFAVVAAFFLWGLEVVGGGGSSGPGSDSPDRSRIPLSGGSGW